MTAPARASAAERLVLRVEALRLAHPERAWRVVRRGFAGAARGVDDAGRGVLWRLRGHVLRSLRKTRAAVDAYRRAERWFARAGAVRERGRCAIGLVDALMYLGRYREALRVAARGRRLLAEAGDSASLARLANNEGNIFHRLDLPEQALTRYRDAGRWLRRSGDARGTAMVEGNVANCLSMLGRCAQARRLYRSVRKAHQTAGFELDALNASYNLAYLDFLEHRYEPALEELGRVRDEATRRGYPSLAALAALDRSEIFLRMGAHGLALAEAETAIQGCAALELSYERAKADTFAALAEHRLGRPASAVARLERSLAAFHTEGNTVWIGETLVGLATVWLHDGNPRAAAALLASARRRFVAAGDREREACCLALLARARLECGQPAGSCLAEACRRGRGVVSSRLRHLTLAVEASMARAGGDTRRAREKLRRAASEAERLAARVLDEQWRSSFWGEWGWPHLELAGLELAEGRVAEALEALERGRGRSLVGAFGRARRDDRPELPRLVREWAASQEARQRRGLAPPERGPEPARHGPTAPSRGGALARALHRLPSRALRAGALQRALPEGQVLVDYFIQDGALGAIVVSRDGILGRPALILDHDLNRLVHSLLFDLRGAAFMPVHERRGDALDAALSEVAALLLWPVLRDALPGRSPSSLAIVPVGALARLPWGAFPLPDGRPLCEAMEIVVVPGLRLSMLAASRPAMQPVSAAGLARVGAGSGVDSAAPPLVIASDAGELQSVQDETRVVTAHFPGARLLAGKDATAERFLELAPYAPWIHFAGHGHFRADAPHESALHFADRWLLADELAGLRLSASWVGLSACQTARALVRPGEEWFGLARSFLVSGAQTVLASQWDIEDEAASRLMGDLYRRLAAGDTLARALSGAQSARRREGAHPLEWSGFVMLGGPGATASDATLRSGTSNPVEAWATINTHSEVLP